MNARRINSFAKKLVEVSLDENKCVSGERVAAILDSLKKSPPRSYKQVLQKFLLKLGNEQRKGLATVTYANGMPEAELQQMHKNLEAHYDRKLELKSVQDDSLIAGFIIHVGDDVWDYSVEGKLVQFSNSFK
jgi:F0F1-type ATP synthase delta subunit